MHHRHRHPSQGSQAEDSSTKGLIVRGGWRYDLTTWVHDMLSFRGTFRTLRKRTLTLAHLQEGLQVLDVGCGTGTLALDAAVALARQVAWQALTPVPGKLLVPVRKRHGAVSLPIFRSG